MPCRASRQHSGPADARVLRVLLVVWHFMISTIGTALARIKTYFFLGRFAFDSAILNSLFVRLSRYCRLVLYDALSRVSGVLVVVLT